MRIIQQYIGRSLAGTFFITLLVLTGILCMGSLLQVADLILKGMDPWLILQFFGFLVVGLLEYAIPMAILTATTLVFGRLSADNEITGMRANGIGLAHITAPVFLFGFVLMLICLYLQNTAIPNYSFATRKMKARIGTKDPDALLQPGEIIEFPGYTIYFDRKENDIFYKIQINQYENNNMTGVIFAKWAELELDQEQEGFTIKLYDGIIEEIIDPENPQIRTTTAFGVFNYPISLRELYEKSRFSDEDKRKKDMTSGELITFRRELMVRLALVSDIIKKGRTRIYRVSRDKTDLLNEISCCTTELHKRLSLAVACVSLVFISIPLAIKAHRNEKTIGMVISLALIFIYYIFIAYADAVAHDYQLFPYLIVWIPNILFVCFGSLWMVKFNRL